MCLDLNSATREELITHILRQKTVIEDLRKQIQKERQGTVDKVENKEYSTYINQCTVHIQTTKEN